MTRPASARFRGRRVLGGALAAVLLATGATASAVTPLVPAPAAHADQVRDMEYWLSDYRIRNAWSVTRGAGQTIAVIDTGVDGSHPDLAGAVVGGADFSGVGAANGQKPIGDEPEHGTLVASLAAGRGHDGTAGVIGAAPAASVLAISVGFGQGAIDSDDQIAQAVRWAVDHGATVINMSLTRNTKDWPESWDDAFLYAMQHNVVIVAAAGNRGSGTDEVGAPATMPGVLTVAGVDRQGRASQEASSQGITIGVSAPSEQLVGALPGDQYATWSGTSGATPIVSGIVALVRAAHPELDANDVIERVIATARDAGTPGPDYLYGYGLVDAYAAVTADVPHVDANPMGDLAAWVTLHRRAAVTATPQPATVQAPQAGASALPRPRAESGGVPLPSVNLLRDAGVPLLVLLLFGGGAIALGVTAARQFGRARRAR